MLYVIIIIWLGSGYWFFHVKFWVVFLSSALSEINAETISTQLRTSDKLHSIYLKETSMVKYTPPLPCIGLSGSDSKLYTNFGFCAAKKS